MSVQAAQSTSSFPPISERTIEDDEEYVFVDSPGKVRTLRFLRIAIIVLLLTVALYAVLTPNPPIEDSLTLTAVKTNEKVVKVQIPRKEKVASSKKNSKKGKGRE
jgi:hypothetical protein